MEAHVSSIAHGGEGSWCCAWCDPQMAAKVAYEKALLELEEERR